MGWMLLEHALWMIETNACIQPKCNVLVLYHHGQLREIHLPPWKAWFQALRQWRGEVGDSVHSLCGRQSGNQGSVSSVRQTLPITRRHSTILYIPAGNSTNHSHFLSVSLLLDCDCLQKFVYNKSTHPDEPLNQYREVEGPCCWFRNAAISCSSVSHHPSCSPNPSGGHLWQGLVQVRS